MLLRLLDLFKPRRSCHWCTAYIPRGRPYFRGILKAYCNAEHAARDGRRDIT